jgi:hypothetical protein
VSILGTKERGRRWRKEDILDLYLLGKNTEGHNLVNVRCVLKLPKNKTPQLSRILQLQNIVQAEGPIVSVFVKSINTKAAH